ncbi:hypothetical protein SAMN05421882_10442 [Nitrosomonas communis]|uniref:Uncharacterized protein n=1 Tax=Nitrosomonas communis TaxID=44574 RepID=A0A1H2XWY6_9PROT|nr:hypothetical protein SAMN05421882_10442 [Nitrosomonas communis]
MNGLLFWSFIMQEAKVTYAYAIKVTDLTSGS